MLIRVDGKTVAAQRYDGFLHYVVLIPDVSDDLFQNIFHGNQTERPAVVVRHDSDTLPVFCHKRQQFIQAGTLMHKERLIHKSANIGLIAEPQVSFDKGTDGENADHMIHRPVIDRQTAVIAGSDRIQDLFQRA